MFKPLAIYWSDGYKPGHKAMLAPNTVRLYGTSVPRSLKYAPKNIKKILSIGQQIIVRWLHDEFEANFFSRPIEDVEQFGRDMSKYLGVDYDIQHFRELHALGYLPIKFKSLPEGIETPVGIPHLTVINTVDGYAWLTLYLETIISALGWKAPTAGTISLAALRCTTKWVKKTDPENEWLIPYLCHDFSARGLDPYAMIAIGLAHAACFRGSDTLITIPAARYYYDEDVNTVQINSVNASEHSVSTTCIFTMGEIEMLKYWMGKIPNGILSVVMDTVDLTRVVTPTEDGYLSILKNLIINRDGKLVIRPDSNPAGLTPADIICGHNNTLSNREMEAYFPNFYHKGLIQCLWEIFGGTMNSVNYKVLNSHIGGILGDGLTLELQEDIYQRLADKGFAATNIVLGLGSYLLGFHSRDTFGWAIKGNWFETINDGVRVGHSIFKEPMTDSGFKKSLKGLCAVFQNDDGEYYVEMECTEERENDGLLHVIYVNGEFYNQTTLTEIRRRIGMAV
jgi:nicotinamide phosphoribosyltransferase